MKNILNSWDFINHYKGFVDHYSELNKEFRDHIKNYKFERHYVLDRGLSYNLYPLKLWFKKDIKSWMSEWDTSGIRGEMLHAEITVHYTTVSGIPGSAIERYKYYSETPMSNQLRLLKWKQFLVLSAISNRLNIAEKSLRVEINSVHVNLEWYDYPSDLGEIWKYINKNEALKD